MEFDNETVQAVWEKARSIHDRDPTEWRKDECGAWIRCDQYANHISEFGWKIENVALGKSQALDNLRPYQHENSFDKATGRPHCRVTADREGVPPTASIDTPRNKSAS
jgi:hypothetical protein